MKPSFRAWFLIIAACIVFKPPLWISVVILIGYGISEYLDQWQARKARETAFDDVIFGWEPCKDEPEYEEKGSLSRIRLTGQDQILAARIADLLVRMR